MAQEGEKSSKVVHLLKTLLLPPLLSITFVLSAFYAYVWNILEGTSKAHIFSRHIIQ